VSTYALADTTTQWFADDFPGVRFTPNCGVLHTTESTGWPGYDGGAKAPNYTARPDFTAERLVWRAHFPDEMSSRALRNLAGGVETNTLNAVQVELVGTCDPVTRFRWRSEGKQQDVDFIFWPEAPEWALRDLAAFIADMYKRHEIKIQGPDVWMAYPASFGRANPNRFTFIEWRAFYGWCGHQHVPENSHGDPGALPWAKVAEYALELLKPPLLLTVLTANLGRGVTEAELTANVHRLRHSKAVKGFQEIDEADRPEEHAVLAREIPPGWAAFDTRVPINVPPPWRIVRTRITRACDGLPHFTPHRLITQALIELLDDDHVTPRLVVVNLHFPRRAPQTLTRRRSCRRALRAVITYWHGLGYTVVWMGDTNQVRMRKMHDLEQPVVDAGLDHIRVVPHPDGVQVEVLRTGSVDLTIDGHDAHYARLRLTTPKETTS